MNLVPIDTAGAQAELHGSDATSGGDFAALITGLMSGDTQIVPLLDLLAEEHLPPGGTTAEETVGVDASVPSLEFIGMPPSGSGNPAAPQDPTRSNLSLVAETTQLAGSVDDSANISEPEDQVAGPGLGVEATPESDAEGLASVHPIASQPVNPASPTAVGSSTPSGAPDSPASAPRETPPGPAVASAPRDTPDGATESAPHTTPPVGAAATPAEGVADRTPLDTPPPPVGEFDGPATNPRVELRTTPETSVEPTNAAEPQAIRHEVEFDTGTSSRPLEAARTVATVSPTAMVGIARRVEEAIAALATKPDPKIVTLQLDELDGLRLTVALRPDGLHLSSSGDADLTTDIERALAARGFDMASDGREDRQTSEEDAGDSWRPQTAPTRSSRRTNPSGIRL